MRGSVQRAICSVFALWTSVASAQPPPGAVPVVVVGEQPMLRLTLATEEDAPPFARCHGACTVFLYPSDYWLTVGATSETAEGTRRVKIEGPTELRVTPREERPAGGTLGFVGACLAGGGIGLFAVGLAGSGDGEGGAGFMVLGLLSAVTGLVLGIASATGSDNAAPDVESRPLR